MRKTRVGLIVWAVVALHSMGWAWHDETHVAIARAAGYAKWFNAAGADMVKIKAGEIENSNHFVNNPPHTVVTAQMVLDQAERYNQPDSPQGHLYGAIIASLRDYRAAAGKGKYAEYHLAFCAHYVGDLSQPLHNTPYNAYNRRYHSATDGVINDEVLDHYHLIPIYPIVLHSEADLAREVARIANISLQIGFQVEQEGRILSRKEAYEQIGHSASLFRAILSWLGRCPVSAATGSESAAFR